MDTDHKVSSGPVRRRVKEEECDDIDDDYDGNDYIDNGDVQKSDHNAKPACCLFLTQSRKKGLVLDIQARLYMVLSYSTGNLKTRKNCLRHIKW